MAIPAMRERRGWRVKQIPLSPRVPGVLLPRAHFNAAAFSTGEGSIGSAARGCQPSRRPSEARPHDGSITNARRAPETRCAATSPHRGTAAKGSTYPLVLDCPLRSNGPRGSTDRAANIVARRGRGASVTGLADIGAAVIGTGFIGTVHVEALRRIG